MNFHRKIKEMVIITISLFAFNLKGQDINFDTLNLNSPILEEVDIIGELDTAKYIWNLLKYNYELNLKDTTLYYNLDYTIKLPQYNTTEHFNGIIKVVFKNKTLFPYLCEGNYTDTNKIDSIYSPSINIPIISIINYIPKYKKFKRLLQKKYVKYSYIDSLFYIKHKYYLSKYSFNGKIINNISTNFTDTVYKKLFNLIVYSSYTQSKFKYINKKNILKKYVHNTSFSFKKINFIIKINTILTQKPKHDKEIKIDIQEDLYSLHQKLEEYKQKLKEENEEMIKDLIKNRP